MGGLPASLPSLPQRSSSAAWCACGWAWRRCRVRSAASSAARSPRTALSTAWSAASAACAASRAARSPTSAASAAASPSAATCSRRRDSASFSRRREIWEQSVKGVAGEPAELGRAESRQTMQAGRQASKQAGRQAQVAGQAGTASSQAGSAPVCADRRHGPASALQPPAPQPPPRLRRRTLTPRAAAAEPPAGVWQSALPCRKHW